MSDKLHEYTIGNQIINLYEVVSFDIKGQALVVFNLSDTLYFNKPIDIQDLQAEYDRLKTALDELKEIIEAERVEPMDRQDKNFEDLNKEIKDLTKEMFEIRMAIRENLAEVAYQISEGTKLIYDGVVASSED